MRPKSLILLVLALGCGLVASIGINRVMANRPAPEMVMPETVEICVAALDVNSNDPVMKDAIKMEAWPADKVPQGSIRALEDCEGRRTRVKLFAGEPIREDKLLPKGQNGAAAVDNIPTGYGVVAVRVDDVTTLGSLLLPGDRVDLMVHIPASGTIRETITKTFLQDVKVFAVNDVTERQPGGSGEAKITARTVSFLVTPEQAELVTMASEIGKVRLVLRGPKDFATAPTKGVLPHELLGETDRGNRGAELGMQNPFQVVAPPVAEPVIEDDEPAVPEFKMTVISGSDVQEFTLEEGSMVARAGQGNERELFPPSPPAEGPVTEDNEAEEEEAEEEEDVAEGTIEQ